MRPGSLLLLANRHNVMQSVAAGYVHNLRNPVQAIMMSAGALESDAAPEMVEQFATIIAAEADRAHEMLNLMSDLFGEDPVEGGPVALEPLLRVGCDMGYAMRPRTGVEPDLVVDEDLPAVAGNERDILQAVINLISNAKWATRAVTEPAINITATKIDSGVAITVTDNGKGVAEELSGDPFDLYSTDREEAAGLGLAATLEIASKLGGSVALERDEEALVTRATFRLLEWRAA